MRNFPPWLWLLLALVFGTTATYMATGWLKKQSQQKVVAPAPPTPYTEVVVASKEIDRGSDLSSEQLTVARYLKDEWTADTYARKDEVLGRVAAYNFAVGDPIRKSKLLPPGTPKGLTAIVPIEKRAMTVRVDEASGVAGFLNPGNLVDVVVTIKGGEGKESISKLVLQNLKVLTAGQEMVKSGGAKPQVVPTVTLEVTPEEGEKLALASREGAISLVLRGQKPVEAADLQEKPGPPLVQTQGANVAQLLWGAGGPQGADTQGNQQTTIEVIRRLERKPLTF